MQHEVEERRHVVRFVRAVPKPDRVTELERWVDMRYRERAGLPGLISFFLMRSWSDGGPEFAVATVWEDAGALERYVAMIGGTGLEPEAASMVDAVTVTVYELLEHADYDLLMPSS
jgi:Antibiotic biosynthesis monooxygenase